MLQLVQIKCSRKRTNKLVELTHPINRGYHLSIIWLLFDYPIWLFQLVMVIIWSSSDYHLIIQSDYPIWLILLVMVNIWSSSDYHLIITSKQKYKDSYLLFQSLLSSEAKTCFLWPGSFRNWEAFATSQTNMSARVHFLPVLGEFKVTHVLVRRKKSSDSYPRTDAQCCFSTVVAVVLQMPIRPFLVLSSPMPR